MRRAPSSTGLPAGLPLDPARHAPRGPVCVFNPDQWDGYAASRARVLDTLRELALDNVVILTGDIHSSWALDITDDPFTPHSYDPLTGAGSLAVELVAPGITSPGVTDPVQAAQLSALVRRAPPRSRARALLGALEPRCAATHGLLRVATFNASLNRSGEGQLIDDPSTADNAQARAVAEIIQHVQPDVLLINEFDFDAGGEALRSLAALMTPRRSIDT